MVGRSLPLALLYVWRKYRERWSADNGEEGFRDTRLAVAAGLKGRIELSPKVYEFYVCRGSNPDGPSRAWQATPSQQHSQSVSREGFAGTRESSAMLGRPVLWGLASGAEAGVRYVLEMVRQEFDLAMALSGCPTLSSITRDPIGDRKMSGRQRCDP